LLGCLLLAVWLPATMHCQIETAGLLTSSDECCEHDAQGCADTVCPSVEQNLIKNTSPVAAPAALEGCACHFCALPDEVRLAQVPAIVFPSEAAPPPELAVGWQFSARAVAPARAPSFIA
jgi:hypothetical protein